MFFVDFFKRSFLFDRLYYRDVFAGQRLGWRSHFVKFDRFEQDARTLENSRTLRELVRESGLKVMAVHLPTATDIAKGEYDLSAQQRRLLESFQRLIDGPVTGLVGDPAYKTLDRRTAFRQDGHPSQEGAAAYAHSIALAVCKALGLEERQVKE